MTATIGEQATPAAAAGGVRNAPPPRPPKLGLTLQNLTPELAQRYGLTEKAGVVIADVEQGSPAAEAGLQEGDLIVEVNHKKVTKVGELQAALDESKKAGSVLLLVKRKDASLFVVLQLK